MGDTHESLFASGLGKESWSFEIEQIEHIFDFLFGEDWEGHSVSFYSLLKLVNKEGLDVLWLLV